MKVSSATSATAATDSPRPRTGRRSASQPTLTSAEGFALAGRSRLPDPLFNAYRPDLADVRLAGEVIASHYAEPLERIVAKAALLRCGPSEDSEAVAELAPGAPFRLLDDTLGWAWGYGGEERRVGYVRSEAIEAPA